MALTNEDLRAISQMMDEKLDAKLDARLKPIENELQDVKSEVHCIKLYQENVIMPRLNTIEACYTDTYKRYRDHADRMEEVYSDVDLLKKVVAGHSEKLQKLGMM